MKYVQKFESYSSDELEDHFLEISDLLGKPLIRKQDSSNIFIFMWNLGFNLNEFNDIKDFDVVKHKMTTLISVITPLKNRLSEFNVSYKFLNEFLIIEILKKSKSKDTDYKLISHAEGRQVTLNKFEVLRFFNDLGYRIINTETIDDDGVDITSLIITTNGGGSEFVAKLKEELKIHENNIKIIDVYLRNNKGRDIINIIPEEEKCYISI